MLVQEILTSFGSSGITFLSYLEMYNITSEQFDSASTELRCQSINSFLGYPELNYVTDDIAIKEIFHKFTLYQEAFESYDPSEDDFIKKISKMEMEERIEKYPGIWDIVLMAIKDCIKGLSSIKLSIKDCVIPTQDQISLKDCIIARIDPDLEYYRLKAVEAEVMNKFWFMSIERTWNPIEVPF